jgi:hypothetical protein
MGVSGPGGALDSSLGPIRSRRSAGSPSIDRVWVGTCTKDVFWRYHSAKRVRSRAFFSWGNPARRGIGTQWGCASAASGVWRCYSTGWAVQCSLAWVWWSGKGRAAPCREVLTRLPCVWMLFTRVGGGGSEVLSEGSRFDFRGLVAIRTTMLS